MVSGFSAPNLKSVRIVGCGVGPLPHGRPAHKARGVEKVQWVAEDDDKTCGVCNALDGEVFPIIEAPPKAHHNCRCYYIPVK